MLSVFYYALDCVATYIFLHIPQSILKNVVYNGQLHEASKKVLLVNLCVGINCPVCGSVFLPRLPAKNLLIPSSLLFCSSIVFGVITAVYYRSSFQERDVMISSGIAAILGVLSCLMIWVEKTTYTNIIFSNFHIHPDSFRFVALFAVTWTAVSLIPLLIQKNKPTFFFVPFLIISALTFARFSYESVFPLIGTEDGLIEWLTCLFFLGTVPIAVVASLKSARRKEFLAATVCGVLAVVLIFLAGEEISWGQRVAQLAVPEYFSMYNVQQEINFHNIDPIQKKMFIAYVVGGSWGSLGWVLWNRLPSSIFTWNRPVWPADQFVPAWFISSFFFAFLWYGVARFLLGPMHYKTWEETAELSFSIGVFLFAAMHRYSPIRSFFPSSTSR